MATPQLGAGAAPAGSSQAGFGAPATATPPSGSPHRDTTGQQWGSRAIDGQGHYVFGDDGRVAGMPDVQQLVILAATEKHEKSAVPDIGERYSEVRKIGANVQQEMDARAAATFAHLVDAGWVRIDGVEVQVAPSGGLVAVIVHLFDLTTQTPIAQQL